MSRLVLCPCGLAKHQIPAGRRAVFECEHCDRPCTERGCAQCRALTRSAAKS